MKRIVVAAVLGGLVVFLSSAVTHMVLPLGEAGIKGLPPESGVVGALKTGLPEPGLYLFPGQPGEDSPEAMAKWEEEQRTGPAGFLVYRPIGGEFNFPRHLGTELLTNILAAAIAAWVVARTRGTYLGRVGLVAALGIFAWLSVSASYWNWYSFPTTFIAAEGLDQLIGWLLAGLVIARFAPSPER